MSDATDDADLSEHADEDELPPEYPPDELGPGVDLGVDTPALAGPARR